MGEGMRHRFSLQQTCLFKGFPWKLACARRQETDKFLKLLPVRVGKPWVGTGPLHAQGAF